MILRYGALLTVAYRHTFYTDELSADLFAAPTPWTSRRMSGQGLVFRPVATGFAVYGDLDPNAEPPELLRTPDHPMVLAFTLHLSDRTFLNFTDLPGADLDGKTYYLNNLRNDPADGHLYLGDSIDDARIGDPVTLVAQRTHRYATGAAAATHQIEVEDLFGVIRHTADFTFDEPVSEVDVDLGDAFGTISGAFTIRDDHGGSERIYYAPELYGSGSLAIVELFSSTDTLTPDESDLVPAAYRFLDGSEVTKVDYSIGFEARETTRRYVVTKKYDSSTVELDGLTIQGATFNKTTDTDTATFESDTAVALSQTGEDYDLHDNGTKLLDLPNPGRGASLQEGPTPGSYTSEVFIYV